ncbi:MAG: BolA family transcriptional regulator, partial [Proteobacteria bacterium]|nr:BolA family transcriptional regulator [Pseudomonadota bacterium]
MSTVVKIRQQLAELQPQRVEIADDSAQHAGHAGAAGGGGHYRLTIVSAMFAGLNTLKRHRLVHAALGTLMQHEIHALSITALTPEES